MSSHAAKTCFRDSSAQTIHPGRVAAVLIVAAGSAIAQNTLALAGTGAGLYLSRDRANSWEKIAGLGDIPVRAVAVDGSDLRRLYIVSPDALLTSGDGGLSWSPTAFSRASRIQRLVAYGGSVHALCEGVLWTSPDVGLTWRADTGAPGMVLDISLDAGSATRIYALTTLGLYIRSDTGAWIPLTPPAGVQRILADPEKPGALILAAGSTFARTADGGLTWTNLPPISDANAMDIVGAGFSGDFETIVTKRVLDVASGERAGAAITLAEICIIWDGSEIGCGTGVLSTRNGEWRPAVVSGARLTTLAADRQSDLALTGGIPWPPSLRQPVSGLYRSPDGGANWTPVAGFEQITVTAVTIQSEPLESWSRVYAGTTTGLLSSEDAGVTWVRNASLPAGEVLALGLEPRVPGLLIAATSNGLYRSTDSGAVWERADLPLEILARSIVVDPSPGGLVYLVDRDARKRARLWSSADRGRTWSLMVGQPQSVNDVAVDGRASPSTIYICGSFGLQVSYDGGATWSPSPNQAAGRRLKFDEHTGRLFRAQMYGGMDVTASGGIVEWLNPPLDLISRPAEPSWPWSDQLDFEAFDVVSARAGALTACGSVWFFAIGDDIEVHAVFTRDAGEWRANQLGPCNSVLIDKRAPEFVYIGAAPFRSADGGRTWSQVRGIRELVNAFVAEPMPRRVLRGSDSRLR